MNSIKASGKKSAWKANNTPNEQSRPSFDTSIQADVRGRKLFDNMKKSDPHVVNHNSSGPLSSSQLEYKPQASMSSTMSSTISPQSSLSSLSNWLLSIRKEIQTSLDSNSIRSLTLNECKDLVSSILDSRQQILQKIKQKIESTQQEIDLNGLRLLYSSHLVGGTIVSNPKIQANLSSLCPDTLEVYVYQMMEKKYGLRSLAVEHSAMLLQGVATYRQQDITIRLFDYMFRNIIEEEYRGVIDELKKSVKDLLTVGMMNK